ncbi:M23 family metallopeptidase [[Clostridium] spiroforme]|nr:M23 family metallopeptidase [Thomasclavelia spiroformis]MBM6881285.1 M23 family metallopeptidase [Thomasclavelia spiroformis]MBM6930913.1 M23 family metallopeptidase [Thomasclavelia spiroformis]
MKGIVRRNKKTFVLMASLMLFLAGAGVFQNVIRQDDFEDVPVVSVETKTEEEKTVETIQKPVGDDVVIEKKFYDPDLSDEELEQALVYFEGVYRPNDGIDYTKNGEVFDVLASFSGEVVRKENDSLLGWIVAVENESGMVATYQAIDNIKVEKGDQVVQGDVIASSGNNVYQSALKNHLHFILSKDDETLNPEKYFGKELVKTKNSSN